MGSYYLSYVGGIIAIQIRFFKPILKDKEKVPSPEPNRRVLDVFAVVRLLPFLLLSPFHLAKAPGRVARVTADGAGKMEGIRIAAIFGDFAQGEAGGTDELDGVLHLDTPDHGAGAFAPGLAKKRAKPAAGDANAPGQVLPGMEFGVVAGGNVERAL
jgi:hypothetical protein